MKLFKRFPILASRREFSYFKRAFFSMNDEYLQRALTLGDIRVSVDGSTIALLDLALDALPPRPPGKGAFVDIPVKPGAMRWYRVRFPANRQPRQTPPAAGRGTKSDSASR